MRWVGHAARLGEGGNAHTIVEAKSKERDRLKTNVYRVSNIQMYLEKQDGSA